MPTSASGARAPRPDEWPERDRPPLQREVSDTRPPVAAPQHIGKQAGRGLHVLLGPRPLPDDPVEERTRLRLPDRTALQRMLREVSHCTNSATASACRANPVRSGCRSGRFSACRPTARQCQQALALPQVEAACAAPVTSRRSPIQPLMPERTL